MRSVWGWFAVILLLAGTCLAGTSVRKVISLDGQWQIAQGGLTDEAPQTFNASIPVPGLADMAQPAFTEVGKASPQREAFWYKRTFSVPGKQYPVAILKVNKAMFGTKAWLNGTPVGEHLGCFTPGYFDVSKAIFYGAENSIVIRIGACRESLPESVPAGTDYEKTVWTPGIYDSVSLTLTDSVFISSVQVAPRIADGTATVQVVLQNHGNSPITTNLAVSAKEWKSARQSASSTQSVEITPHGQRVITETIRLRNPHLWSPEDPFLYVLNCQTVSDAVETRFGMREFRYDEKTGCAILNGRPYYLRGTNFCLFRFFEDPLRGGLPWNRTWARKLLTQPKDMLHWNSARVCIAPFPEFWYDIADETGWLLQDEYPIWGFSDGWSQKELTTEFKEWLQERWNHPSIAVWDACNETLTPRIGELIKAVRGMDLSNRPWDNGYSPRDRPTDAIELHPYTSVGRGEASRIGSALDKSFPTLAQGPLVINEYDAFWMARDGGGTPWFGKWYEEALKPNVTLARKQELLAYNAADVTEYWRARRQAAGVQWFCYLSYSKPNMVTSDNFADMPNAVIESHFLDYMRNAFSPLAVTIDDCEPQLAPGLTSDFRIIVTNDLDKAQSGCINLRFSDGPVSSSKFTVDALGQTVLELKAESPATPGKYLLSAELVPTGGERVLSRRDVEVVTQEQASRLASLADNCPVTASSEFPGCPARFAVDRRKGTRWSSEFSDPQWIMVDLGKPRTISRVVLDWENAYGKAYRIQASNDGRTWTDAYATDQGKGGRLEIAFSPVEARYVRLYGTARGTEWGYSLWSFQVFEK